MKDTVDDFVDYCCNMDIGFQNLREIKIKYKQSKKNNSLTVKEKYVDLATTLDLCCSRCLTKGVVQDTESPFKGKNIRGNPSYRTVSHWYTLNLKLAMGTFASGIGATNMTQLLSFMDIPNEKSLHQRFFKNMETTIGKHLKKIAMTSMEDGIDEEIRLTLNDESKYTQYKNKNLTVALTVSFDMGWSKRSTGNRYDSISCRALKIGVLSDKILQAVVSIKMCITYSKVKNIGEDPPDYIYPKNYEGSSKAMEVDAVLHLYKTMYYNSDGQLTLAAIVADDDSTMRSLLRRMSSENKKGRLSTEIPEPEWLIDPSHQTKIVANPIFNLANSSKKISSCTKVDTMRFKRY